MNYNVMGYKRGGIPGSDRQGGQSRATPKHYPESTLKGDQRKFVTSYCLSLTRRNAENPSFVCQRWWTVGMFVNGEVSRQRRTLPLPDITSNQLLLCEQINALTSWEEILPRKMVAAVR
jgi:hypothetical protein